MNIFYILKINKSIILISIEINPYRIEVFPLTYNWLVRLVGQNSTLNVVATLHDLPNGPIRKHFDGKCPTKLNDNNNNKKN